VRLPRQNFQIRKGGVNDLPALCQLGRQTYRETFMEDFGITYPPEDEAAFIEGAYSEAAFLGYLRSSDHQILLAELEGTAIGYALAGKNSLPHPDAKPGDGELKRLYIVRSAQGSGVGRALFQEGLQWLEQSYPAHPIWIGVWEGNERAQQFYFKNGFKKAGSYIFHVGTVEELDWILCRPAS
jgi:ribosomal protein S18 acetylase RimI-like enzyme